MTAATTDAYVIHYRKPPARLGWHRPPGSSGSSWSR